ncbi:MAG: peptidoglycan-associated lipoprotein Pal [Deltaproteobacteria bacterium]|nr:peptidoglycan-associated lipoprotein Pal [Deltaproteobacteria bacterium]
MREQRLPAPAVADPRPQAGMAEALPRAGTQERRVAPPPGTGAAEPAPDRAVASRRTPSGLERVYFDFDQATLPPAARQTLATNAEYLRASQGTRILIEGHCDERGTTGYNLALGEKRARAVQRYLMDVGIDPNRISIVTYGEEVPLDPRHREEAWAKNRRAEFVKVRD